VFQKSITDLLGEYIQELTKSGGAIENRKEGINTSIDGLDDRIDRLEASMTSYRLRLVNQFTAMEQTLSQLQNQSAGMLAALGQK
jgi:flagellar capping protein FliD